MKETLNPIFLMTLITFIVSVFSMNFFKKIAIKIGIMDVPNEKRKIHKEPIPYLGGLGIFFSFLIGYMIFGNIDSQMISILISSFIIIVIGLLDDIGKTPPIYRLIAQVIAGCVLIFYGDLLLSNINFFGITINFGIFAYPITLFFILGSINAINLIDGMDGLSSGICSIYFFAIGIVALMTGALNSLEITLTFLMLGATLGYLYHNFHPAKIYMGDAGSTFLGLIIATIALLGYKTTTIVSFYVPLLLLAIPVMDTLFAIIRRMLKKLPPMKTSDKSHLHHQILRKTNNIKKTVLIIYGIDLLFAAASIFHALENEVVGRILYAILFLIVLYLVLKTDIIYEKKKKK